MRKSLDNMQPRRVLVVLPTWVGDCVMATPTLRAIRARFPHSHITGLLKRPVKHLLEGSPWLDRLVSIRRQGGVCVMAERLKASKFDLAILLPNSFRSALLVALARVPRRFGYERDWRGVLLTDQVKPLRQGLGFKPDPTLGYYLRLADALGADTSDQSMALFTREQEDAQASHIFAEIGQRPLVILNPGANREDKRWPAERFAAMGDWCAQQYGAYIAVTGAPRERELVASVVQQAKQPILNLLEHNMTMRLLKSVTRKSQLMITNDTGPRHVAAAFGVPVVTLFGPTPPQWTRLDYPQEREVLAPNSNMHELTLEPVQQAVAELWQDREAAHV